MNKKTELRMVFLILIAAAVLFNLSCSDDDEDGEVDTTGFTVYVSENDNGNYYVRISMADIPETVPSVTVNGEYVDSIYLDMGLSWVYRDVDSGTITYSIQMDGDELTDTISDIPGPITGVTCNGVTVPDNVDTDINLASTYSFVWSTAAGDNSFIMDLRSDGSGDWEYEYEGYYDGTDYLFSPDLNPVGMGIRLMLYPAGSPEVESGSAPNIESDTMYAFYEIKGSEYYCDITIIP
jgi:hypothetical protein